MLARLLTAAAICCALVSPSYAQKTKATLNTEINTNFPDNSSNFITPQLLRNTTADIVNSIMPTAPVVSGNFACYDGTTGLFKDCGSAPSSLVIASTNVTYLPPFTGGVSETQSAYNSQRPSVKDFGAKCDGFGVSTTASIASGNNALTAVGASFSSTDVLKAIMVPGAGVAGAPLVTTISAVSDATHITLAANAATTLSAVSKNIYYGTDDTNALQSAANIVQPVYIPGQAGVRCITTSAITFSVPTGGFVGAAGWDNSTILSFSLTANIITINNGLNLMAFKNLQLARPFEAVGFVSSSAIGLGFLGDTENTVIDNVHTFGNGIGIQLGTTSYSTASNLISERNVSHAILITDSQNNSGFQWQLLHTLSQNGGGYGVAIVTGNNSVNVGSSVETWFDVKTFANTLGGIGILGTANNPINSFRLIGGFLGGDNSDEIHFDSHDLASGHFISDTFIELSGQAATGPLSGTAPSGTGRAINITANNTEVLINNVKANQNSQDGVNTAASVFTQIVGSSFTLNGGWGVLAADGSKISVNASRTSGNTSGACSFTSNANSSIGYGNTPSNSTCNSLNNTTASTSKTTGSLVTGGGLGVGGNAYIGGALSLSGQGVPTIASGACGTGTNGVLTSGTNQSGLITIGAAATTTCTVTFSATLSNAPGACTLTPANAAAAATATTVARVSSIGTSSWVITGSALANAAYYYQCI